MNNLLAYSGLTTKIRAMESQLIQDADYRKLAEFSTVGEVVSFLKHIPGYRRVFEGMDENQAHRGEVERRLKDSVYWGYSRLYHFADQNQRKFLRLYFQRYELSLLKWYFRMVTDHRQADVSGELRDFEGFFRKHSQLNLDRLSNAGTMDDLLAALKGTEYYPCLSHLREKSQVKLFDYEMALDMYYFSAIWKKKDKILRKQDLESITRAYGVKFDLLNLDWIYRSKQYYHMSDAATFAMLIPMHYKLTKKQVIQLVEAPSVDEFSAILNQTWYANRFENFTAESLEDMYVAVLKSTLLREAGHHPYSAAIMYSYLYQKEHEVDRLTTALECIRYQLDPVAAYKYIVKN